jgi:hypothetical protein
MAGVPFTMSRWRRFYSKNQIFITLCMECAYLDNLRAQEMKMEGAHGKMDEKQAAINAIKHPSTHNIIVRQNIKKRHVRNIVKNWIQLARANILHEIKVKP